MTIDHHVEWAIAHGINYFDVAPTYGDAQKLLGNSLKPYRNQVYLACKAAEKMRHDPSAGFQCPFGRCRPESARTI